MQVPAVSLAVRTIANAVGGLPVKLYVRNGRGKEVAPAHPAFTLAHDEANPWTSAAELRAQLTRDALLHDNGGFAQPCLPTGALSFLQKVIGWGTWIRTKIDGVRVRCSTIELFPSRGARHVAGGASVAGAGLT